MYRITLTALSALVLIPFAHAGDATDAEASQFVGAWQIAFQDGPDVIVNVPTATCENPANIRKVSESVIDVTSPKGSWGHWQVKSFSGKNPWWHLDATTGKPDDYSLVAVWKDDNRFILADRLPGSIKFDYDNAKEWTRCPQEASVEPDHSHHHGE